VGALNTFNQAGPWAGIVVLLADAAKGVLAVGLPWLVGADYWVIFATTPLVVVGHNWPVFLNFQGGKGAATILGISLMMVPVLTIISAAPSILLMWLLRNVVLGAALGFVMVNILILVTGQQTDQVALCYFLTFLVSATYIVAHRRHIVESVRHRRWKKLLFELSG
jgi:glycerol-3-phosphate acyltransferase PlsY